MTSRPADAERVRTVFLGSGAFGEPALRVIASHPRIELVGVVTAPPRPVGRKQVVTPTAIGRLASELGLGPVLAPVRLRSPEAIASVLELRPTLAVLADYGQIVPPGLLDLPFGALNIHPSPLPRFRGASPIPATILAGDDTTAVTLMRMDEGLDTGPIVAQAPSRLDGTETAPQLEARLAALGGTLLEASLDGWLDGSIPAVPQDAAGVVLTRPLRREDGRLDPALTAAQLARAVRAYQPWPGTFLELEGERLVVNEASIAPAEPADRPGDLVDAAGSIALATGDGRLVLDIVTPAGRRTMTGAEYLRGRRQAV